MSKKKRPSSERLLIHAPRTGLEIVDMVFRGVLGGICCFPYCCSVAVLHHQPRVEYDAGAFFSHRDSGMGVPKQYVKRNRRDRYLYAWHLWHDAAPWSLAFMRASALRVKSHLAGLWRGNASP